MTFIQPHKPTNTLTVVLFALAGLAVAGIFTLVAVYNNVVNTTHNIADLKAKLDQIGAENTQLQNQIVAQLGSDAIARVAASQGLVEDKAPHYIPVAGGSQSLSLR